MTYNYDPYNPHQYTQHQTFENQANERSSQIFWDAVSMTSSDRNSIAMSVYHSVPELHYDENAAHNRQKQIEKVTKKSFAPPAKRKWSSFMAVWTVSSCKKFYACYCLFANSNNNHPFLFTSFLPPYLQIWQDPKSVDFILAYNGYDRQKIKRQIFERNLLSEGLLLDRDETQDVHFLKIHVTHEVLCRYAEILKFKFPIKLDEDDSEFALENESKVVRNMKSMFEGIYKHIRLDKRLFPHQKYELYHEFSRDKSYLFDVNEPNFFPCYVRLAVVNFILERTAFADNTEDNLNCIGIDKLLSDVAYISAYPLHDGHHMDQGSQRALLFNEW